MSPIPESHSQSRIPSAFSPSAAPQYQTRLNAIQLRPAGILHQPRSAGRLRQISRHGEIGEPEPISPTEQRTSAGRGRVRQLARVRREGVGHRAGDDGHGGSGQFVGTTVVLLEALFGGEGGTAVGDTASVEGERGSRGQWWVGQS